MAHGYKHLIHSWLVLTDESCGQQHLLILAEETALAILEGTGEDGLAPFIAVRKGQCCLKAQTLVLHGALRIETIPPSGRYLFEIVLLFHLFHKPIGDDISGFYGHLAVGFVLQGGLALHLMGPEVVNLIDSGIEGGAQVAHL